jgi:flagellar biosynthesis/type III secretory pathway protein FliH
MGRVREAPTGRAALLAVFRYIGRVTELLSPRAILSAVERTAPETKEIVMTLAEHWLQEGFEKGRTEGLEQGLEKGLEQGVEKGKAEGRAEGERGILERLLKLKFGAVPEWALLAMANAREEQLLGWADRVISAASLDEVFGR